VSVHIIPLSGAGCGAIAVLARTVGYTACMIGHEEILDRQDRARSATEQARFDALLVVGRSFYDRPGDLAYLTNHFPPFPSTVFTGEHRGLGHGFLLLPVAGDPTLITDPRKHRTDLVPIADVRASTNLGATVIDLLRERGLERGRIAVASDDIMPAPIDREIRAALPGLTLEPQGEIVSSLRRIKSVAEQAALRRAAEAADAALTAAVKQIQTGRATERDACAAGIHAAMANGADFVRYMRVHSGPWSSMGSRWPQSTDRQIVRGDLIVLDAIGAVEGYQFDVNRSLSCGPTDAERMRLLETVHDAVTVAVESCRAGSRVRDVVSAARSVIDRSPFANAFGGMMGHGIGLETVEEPLLTPENDMVLEPGMVLCVEPGLFVPNWGGALIEQEVIIGEDGPPEVITRTPVRLW
jgi:Xaa-Pro aminopeptidase